MPKYLKRISRLAPPQLLRKNCKNKALNYQLNGELLIGRMKAGRIKWLFKRLINLKTWGRHKVQWDILNNKVLQLLTQRLCCSRNQLEEIRALESSGKSSIYKSKLLNKVVMFLMDINTLLIQLWRRLKGISMLRINHRRRW